MWAQFLDHPIKKIRLDNTGEFTSQALNDYYISIGIDVEHPVAHTHTQNGLVESWSKDFKWLLVLCLWKQNYLFLLGDMPTSLVRIIPIAYHKHFLMQLVCGQQPNVSHFWIFGCAIYVPIAPPQHTKMGSQRRLGIYVGFDSPSIIRYLEPSTDDVFKACFDDCYFDETVFPTLGGEKSLPEAWGEITWNVLTLSHLDPCTNQCELEVQRIIHLQIIANQLLNVFTDSKKIMKSHILAANTPVGIEVPVGQSINTAANESKPHLKCGRLVGDKDKTPRKRKMQEKQVVAHEEAIPMT